MKKYFSRLAATLLVGGLVVFCGCNSKSKHVSGVLPASAPDQISSALETSPSAAPAATSDRRSWPESVACYENVGVPHPAWYLRDPFARYGSNDGFSRAWCFDDLLAALASPPIFVANVVTLPAALAVAPPWQQQVSRDKTPLQQPAFDLPGSPTGAAANVVISSAAEKSNQQLAAQRPLISILFGTAQFDNN